MVDREDAQGVIVKGNIAQDVIRKYHRTPMLFYRLKDVYVGVTSNPNFFDAVLIIAAFIAFASVFPFYPLIIFAILAVVLFSITLRHAFLGLIILIVMVAPMLFYQTPSLAYLFGIIVPVGLIYGYKHYRTFILAAILLPLALSYSLGPILAIPAFIISVLIIGYRRGLLLGIIFVIGVVMLSAVTGIQNSAYISYNAQLAHTSVAGNIPVNYTVPNKAQLTLSTFPEGIGTLIGNVENPYTVAGVYLEFSAIFSSLGIQTLQYSMDIVAVILAVIIIDHMAVINRSAYKGTVASILGIVYPLAYITISLLFRNNISYLLPFASFLITPAILYVLELYRIDIVKALNVRKEDLRLKFGEAFEDLLASSPTERFSEIGDYESTKRELRNTITLPLEEKAISTAYKIKPIRGVLLFGPPGTGKTMLMRAIANDVRAGFFLVKTPNLISAYSGETERRLANIFATAKKNAPCILFFDEVDAIARNRSQSNVDETHRQVLSQLLVEMDGFQKLKNVIVIGATNVPNLIDPALLRPGRIDKIIYMPPPDFNGRKEIFRLYLKKLPVSNDVNVNELAKMTERFSGADIKAICDNVSQEMASEAVKRHRVLEITQNDIKSFISATKPSTTLSQLDTYNKFKIDFERKTLVQERVEKKEYTVISDVIGLEDVKKAVTDAIKIPIEHPELMQKYNVKAIKGILMFGPPGGGKTMLMRAIQNDFNDVTILQINGADIVQDGATKAAAAIKEVFNRAIENSPSILFIDEIDSIAPKREGAGKNSMQLTTEFLQEMDGIKESKGVVLVCATNRPSALDPAILRPGRFDKLIFVSPPDEPQRAMLFKECMADTPASGDMDYVKLAKETEGYTGADIANMCREAKVSAVNESIKNKNESAVTMESLESIIKKIKPSAPASLVKSYQKFLDEYGQR